MKNNDATWHVYALVDPRTGDDFYIGVTTRPRQRRYNHGNDPGSAAWPTVRDIRADGFKFTMRILASYSDKAPAYAHEDRLIHTLSGFSNRLLGGPKHGRKRSPVSQEETHHV